jgi:hypothetical protein
MMAHSEMCDIRSKHLEGCHTCAGNGSRDVHRADISAETEELVEMASANPSSTANSVRLKRSLIRQRAKSRDSFGRRSTRRLHRSAEMR